MDRHRIKEILAQISTLPDTAVVPVAVVAAHDNVCERTVRRNYPIVKLSPGRHGVRVKVLREKAAALNSP